MNKTLKIMIWNANGLANHKNELQLVLDTKNIDVCLVSETHFTKQSFIQFRGYKTYHALHPDNKAKAGSAVIVKENILHHEEFKYEEKEIQAVAIEIKTKRFPLTISSVYCPPRYNLKKEQYKSLLDILGDRFVIGGDFNAKNSYWGSRLTNTKGKELLTAIRETKSEAISAGKPTYWPSDPSKIPDLIDFFIFKNLCPSHLQAEQSFDMSSDHSPVCLEISETVLYKEKSPTLVNKLTDWESFKIELDNYIDLKVPLKTNEQLDVELEQFLKHIQQAAWNNTPDINKPTKGKVYPLGIKQLLSEKRRQRRVWQQSRSPEDKRKLNNMTKKLSKMIQVFNDSSMNRYLQTLTSDSSTGYSLWKATKNLKRPIAHTPPIKIGPGAWAKNNEQKAKRFAEHLEAIFQPNEGESNVTPTLNDENNMLEEEDIRLVTPREVINEIRRNINLRKSPGYDLISGEILKNLPKKALIKLTTLINAALRLKYVPDSWKIAEVIMIAKPGKPPHEASSYRPISLLPIMSKLFEKLFLKRLKPVIERLNLIPGHQFGFREKHSTIDQVHRITNMIEKSLEDKKVCSTVFLDVAQAFDKVWHKGLIIKLSNMLPKHYVDILQSYITNRLFRVRQEDAYSELKEIKAGVPQGSVLGPVLYLLYTCDIPELENNTIATFADDTAIMAIGNSHEEAVEKVQMAVNQVYEWTKKWKIKLNESKSIHIDFSNKQHRYFQIFINNQAIPYENTAKYLGMTLDAKLRWKAHVKKKRDELNLRYKQMYWLLGRNSSLSLQNKLLLYKQVLMPVWTYGIQLWGCTAQSNVLIIQRFQNKVLRDITDAPWYVRNTDLHRDLQVEFVDKVIQRYAEAHENRLHHHVNVEAIQLLDHTDIVRRLKRTKPFELV